MYKLASLLLLSCCVFHAASNLYAAPQTCAELEAWKKEQIKKDVHERTKHHKEIKALRKKALKRIDEQDKTWLKAHNTWAASLEKQYEAHKKALKCKSGEDAKPEKDAPAV